MKTNAFLLKAAVLSATLSLYSCAGNIEKGTGLSRPEPEEEALVSFTASLEPADTRTSLHGLDVCWSEGDQVRVFNAATPEGEVYDLCAGAGTRQGTFLGKDIGPGPYDAVYPASAAEGLKDGALRISLPGEQAYVADSFAPGANVAAARAEVLDGLTFRNLLGILSITLSGEKAVRRLSVFTHAGESLNGTALVGGLDSESPSLAFETPQDDPSRRQLSLDFGNKGVPLSGGGKTFFLMVPAGTLADGFTLEVIDTDGNAMIRQGAADASNRMVRNEIRPMPPLPYTARFQAAFLQSGEMGAYKDILSSQGKMSLPCRYEEGKSQYAYRSKAGAGGSRYFRIADWQRGFLLAFTMPYELRAGETCAVSVQAVGATGGIVSGDAIPMQVVKQASGLVWLFDQAAGIGFIIKKED